MDKEYKVEVMADNLIKDHPVSMLAQEGQVTEYYYSINKNLEFKLSYGVTKVSIKGFYHKKLGGKSLAFYNDLSLKHVFEQDDVLKYECQLYGEQKSHEASVYVHLKREGEATPKYNVFAEMANRIQINKEKYLAMYPEQAKQYEQERIEQEALEK